MEDQHQVVENLLGVLAILNTGGMTSLKGLGNGTRGPTITPDRREAFLTKVEARSLELVMEVLK